MAAEAQERGPSAVDRGRCGVSQPESMQRARLPADGKAEEVDALKTSGSQKIVSLRKCALSILHH